MLNWIRLVQLSDCHQKPTSDMDRCPLGAGTLPVTELVETLETLGYRGFYDVPLMTTAATNGSYAKILQATRSAFEELAAMR